MLADTNVSVPAVRVCTPRLVSVNVIVVPLEFKFPMPMNGSLVGYTFVTTLLLESNSLLAFNPPATVTAFVLVLETNNVLVTVKFEIVPDVTVNIFDDSVLAVKIPPM